MRVSLRGDVLGNAPLTKEFIQCSSREELKFVTSEPHDIPILKRCSPIVNELPIHIGTVGRSKILHVVDLTANLYDSVRARYREVVHQNIIILRAPDRKLSEA